MLVKKIAALILPVLLLVCFSGNAQVVTSKKKAIEKGIYKKPASEVSKDVQNVVSAVSEDNSQKKSTTVAAKPAAAQPKEKAAPAKTTKQVAAKTSKSKRSIIRQTDDPDLIPETEEENYLSLQMINNAMTFLGTRYMGGGTTKAGMDCSGMVTAVFNIFDVKIPRSSNEMAKIGTKIEKSEVKKGDLVFFHTNGKRMINHVGLVVEVLADEIKFIHSSTSKGVIVSSTKEPYYEKTFAQANRML